MAGNLQIPTTFANSGGTDTIAHLDNNFSTIAAYINIRELTVGLLANRPAAGSNGAAYLATDVNGGTLYLDNGLVWTQAGAGAVQASVNVGAVLALGAGWPPA